MNNNFASPLALSQPVLSHPRPTLQLRFQAHHHTLFQSVSSAYNYIHSRYNAAVSRSRQFSKPGSPLTAPVFYVLLSLSIRDRHGYDILKHVEASSEGRIRLGPGTLYTTLKRLLDAGLITELSPDPGEDPRRRSYRLTARGRAELTGELQRMEQAIVLARGRPLRARS